LLALLVALHFFYFVIHSARDMRRERKENLGH